LLLEHGADVNERPKLCLTLGPGDKEERRSETPLHVAVREGQVEAAKWLLEHGADAGLKDCWGRTAVDISITGNMVDIMDVFSSILPG
jgi:ankyrin repeat protein